MRIAWADGAINQHNEIRAGISILARIPAIRAVFFGFLARIRRTRHDRHEVGSSEHPSSPSAKSATQPGFALRGSPSLEHRI
jgi:hypothetical protein